MGLTGTRLVSSAMNIFIIFPLIIIAGVILFLILISIKSSPVGTKYLYRKKGFLMGRAEHELFDILVSLVGNEYHVFPQIHLATILDQKVVGQNWKFAFWHINGKSVDFVICDKKYIKPLLAIELDDKTHEYKDRQNRDMEVEKILNDAQIPLLRIKNAGFFNKEFIATQLRNYLTFTF